MTTAYSHAELAELEVVLAEMTLPAGTDLTSSVMEVSRVLTMNQVPLADQPETVRQLADNWQADASCPTPLREAITAALSKSSDPYAKRISHGYFGLHRKLQAGLAMTFEAASLLTGYASIIGSLAEMHSMSAAQIAMLLRARGVADEVATWAGVQQVLSSLNLAPSLDLARVKEQLTRDIHNDEGRFADADWHASIELMDELATDLGMGIDVGEALASLVAEAGDAHWPYVFMLHFSCVPLDWYDHAPVFLYEFNPRGESAMQLLNAYRTFDTGADPFLNNAKSVDRIDQNWADSKTKQRLRKPASALVAILEEVGSLPFQAKRSYGAAIRQWCLRQIRLHQTPRRPLDHSILDPTPLRAILEQVGQGESQTRGIVEQRLVDAVTSAQYAGEQWKGRGLGDSVNAANAPRRKLGDCEYQDANVRSVHSFEAHAGHLSAAYFTGHRSSLQRVLRARLEEEWLAYSEPTEWDVEVTFVSHTSDLLDPQEDEIEGVRIQFNFLTYADFVASVNEADPGVREAFRRWLLEVLNRPRTPQSVRDQVTQMVSGPG